MLGALELIRGRLIERHGARIRRGVRLLPRMQLSGVETVLVLRFVRHDAWSPLEKDFCMVGASLALAQDDGKRRPYSYPEEAGEEEQKTSSARRGHMIS